MKTKGGKVAQQSRNPGRAAQVPTSRATHMAMGTNTVVLGY